MPSNKRPNAVLALIDAAVVRMHLKETGTAQTGPAELPDRSGTRKKGRDK